MNRRLFYLLWVAFLLALPLFSSAPPAAQATAEGGVTPVVMVAEGANDHTLGGDKLYWRTLSDCTEPPGRTPDDPEMIQRIFTSGSMKRTLLNENDPRPINECNPYHIYSNIVADENFVYWAEDSGLVRLSASANEGDAPTLMSATIKSTGNSQKVWLTENNTHVFAMIHFANVTSQVWAIRKSDSTQELVASFAGFARDLSSDSSHAFWITPGTNTLVMGYRFVAGYTTENITTNVASFASEGEQTICIITCVTTHYVFIAKNHQVFRYNIITNSLSGALYTSSSPDNPYIYSMGTDGTFVFFFERRENLPCPECFIIYTQVLFRMTDTGSSPVALYTHESPLPGYTNIWDLDSDGSYLYWQQDDQILKFPNNAAGLPQTNMTITRLEITQGIQHTSNTVPLIGGRRTIVRAFANGAGDDVENVTAFLYRIDPVTQQEIAGPLAPVNASGTHLRVFDDPKPADVDSSFNFELPLSWVQSGTPLRLKVVLNPYNTPLESNPADNTFISSSLTPIASTRLEAEFYAFGFTDNNNLTHFPRYTKDIEQTFSWIRRTYPLASKPASGNDASAGFRPNIHYVHMSELPSLIMGTHDYCEDFEADELSLCAATYVNSKLRTWQENDEDADGTAYIYYGWIPSNIGFPRGRGGDGVASGPTGAPGSGSWDDDGAYTDWYTAHELGHAIGRQHPVPGSSACGHSDTDDAFPYLGSDIGLPNIHWGFDMGDKGLALPQKAADSAVWHDVMGYCDFQWISDYTYLGLHNQIPDWNGDLRQHRAPAGGEYFALYGTIFPQNNSAYLTYVNQQLVNTIPPIVAGPYAIRLLNNQNQQLAQHAFTPDQAEEGESFLTFAQMVPVVAGTRHVQIVKLDGNVVLVDHLVSANAPTVSNVQATAATNPVTGDMTLTWTGADADNDTLTYDVFYSQDGGNNFKPYLTGITASSTTADSELLGGGSTIFRVVASDGSQTGAGNSPAVVLANKPPQPSIYNPGDGNVVQWGQLISFIGQGFDLQDGSVADANLVWSNQDGQLGTGPFLDVTDLPVGENIITLTATNSKGLSASVSITVIVEDDAAPMEATLSVAPETFGWHIDPGTTAIQQHTVHIANIGSGELDWSVSSDEEWLTVDVTSGTNGLDITAQANPAGMTAPESWSATLTITAQADGRPVQVKTIPVILSMGDIWSLPPKPAHSIYLPLVIHQ